MDWYSGKIIKDNLRKLSVSPFNNEEQIGEYLRGSNVVYYSKPRADPIFGDFERGRRYVEIAKECVERYWQP